MPPSPTLPHSGGREDDPFPPGGGRLGWGGPVVHNRANQGSEELLDLPFDQYTRHRIVARVAESARRVHGRERLDVLDVGGFPCLTPRFIPDDRVVVIDVAEGEPPEGAHYVRADGSALPFGDSRFDLVVSLDSLEHVPRERREAYVCELLRVSRGYALILAPFAQDEVVLAERLLAEFIRVVNQEEQPQLREHRTFGLPELDEWTSFIRGRGYACITFSSGYLYNWLPMMLLKHFVLSLPESEALHRAIDRFYNVALQGSDARTPGYRQGMLISTVGPSAVLDEISVALAPTGQADRLETIQRLEQLGLLFKLAELHLASRKDDRLRDEIIAKDRHILNLEVALRETGQVLEAERARAAALQGQVAALQAHIEAIRSGRVMRTLDAVNRLLGRGA